MLNNVVLMGRLTSLPELKQTPSGVEVTSFSIAVDRDYVRQGEDRQTDFINYVAWRGAAKFITTHFKKGQMIAVTGSIQTRNYEDKDGNKRTATDVVVATASFCGSKTESNNNNASVVPTIDADFEELPDDNFEEVLNNTGLPF
jgi:single-strand DNA-binding protein